MRNWLIASMVVAWVALLTLALGCGQGDTDFPAVNLTPSCEGVSSASYCLPSQSTALCSGIDGHRISGCGVYDEDTGELAWECVASCE